MPVVLRKSEEWCRPADGPAIDRFHAIARQYGSEARWLCQTCLLVTGSQEEAAKNFPYEQWREEALKKKPGITPGGA